jgi:hypothetical protein
VAPFFLLFLFTVLLVTEMLEWDLGIAPGLSVKNALLYLAFALVMIDWALNRNRRLEAMSVILPIVLCIGYAVFTLAFVVMIVDYPGYTILDALVALKRILFDRLIIFLVFFYGLLRSRDATWLIKGIFWVFIIVNLISVMDALKIADLGLIDEREDGRIGGPVGESNQYALYLALFLPGVVALFLLERGVRRVLAAAGIMISVFAFLLTASRGGVVAVLGGAMGAAFLLRRFLPARAVAGWSGASVFAVAVALILATLAGYGHLLYDRFVDQSTMTDGFHLSSGRTEIWSTLLAKMFENPVSLITGYGWDTYRVMREFRDAPHNTYLGLYFELGLFGLGMMTLAFSNVLRIARKAVTGYTPDSDWLIMTFIFGFFMVLVGIFFVELHTPWVFIWAYAGVCLRLALTPHELPVPGKTATESPPISGIRVRVARSG